METPETEVKKDDISADEEIWNILKSHNTGSSTTKEKKGNNKDEKDKPKEVSAEKLIANKERFFKEIEEQERIREERRIASDKEMGEFFENLRREKREERKK